MIHLVGLVRQKSDEIGYAPYSLAWLLSVFGQTGRMTVWARVK